MVPGNKICALRNVVDEVLRFSLHPIFILLNKQYSGKVSNLVVVPKAPSTRIRIEDFWKRCLLVYVWKDEDGCFRIHSLRCSRPNRRFRASVRQATNTMMLFPLISVFVWTGENDSNTLRVNAYFLENGEKKSPFSKISGCVWTGRVSQSGELR